MSRLSRAVLCTALLLSAASAHAGRPLATEDADTLEQAQCEWESVAADAHASSLPPTRFISTQLGCGLGWRSQLALAVGRIRQDHSAVQTLAASGKTGLIARVGSATGLTLAWSAASEKASGQSLKLGSAALALVVTKQIENHWLVHANLGWLHSHIQHQNSSTWNLAVEHALGAGVDLMSEVYGDDRVRPFAGVGVRWAVSERFNLNASAAMQNSSPHAQLLTVGCKLNF
jgi:hypothetical protein